MPLDILLFAAIAVFFVWKLRQVLGTRTGEERERLNPFERPPEEPRSAHDAGPRDVRPDTLGKVVDSDAREVVTSLAAQMQNPAGFTHPTNSLAGGLAQIHILDPQFDEKKFLSGARQAYTMIVEAFAKPDHATLKLLLKPDVYEAFASEIKERDERGEVLMTSVRKITVAEISAARSDGRVAVITVDFSSEQLSVTRNAQGDLIDGDETRPVEVSEAWIFERDTRSNAPNWYLVGTKLR